jgi:lysozyme
MTNQRAAVVGAAAVTAALAGFVAHWEGTEFTPYRDVGGVWTVCEGVTGPAVIPGRVYSRQECRGLLSGALLKHATGLAACINVVPPQKTMSALVSWTYNVGIGAACNSTLVKLLNAGQFEEACRQLPRWNRVNGQPVRGLTNRRAAEMAWCLEGLKNE